MPFPIWPIAGGLASEGASVTGLGCRAYYEIRVEGVLDDRWADWFGGVEVSSDGTQTVISGELADQAALHGLLVKVRDLGLCLVSVRRLDAGGTGNEAPMARPWSCPRRYR